MDFEKSFKNAWLKSFDNREIENDIAYYKVKKKRKKLPVPDLKEKREKKESFYLKNIFLIIKTGIFFFIMFNIVYLIFRLSGIDIYEPYGDFFISLLKKISF